MPGRRFDVSLYVDVKERITKFWAEHPNGRILTTLLAHEGNNFIVQAAIYRDAEDRRAWTTGLAQEELGGQGANDTSALENCETSAIGRALANADFLTDRNRASRQEMEKVNRVSSRDTDTGASANAVRATRRLTEIARMSDPKEREQALTDWTLIADQQQLDLNEVVMWNGQPTSLATAVIEIRDGVPA